MSCGEALASDEPNYLNKRIITTAKTTAKKKMVFMACLLTFMGTWHMATSAVLNLLRPRGQRAGISALLELEADLIVVERVVR